MLPMMIIHVNTTSEVMIQLLKTSEVITKVVVVFLVEAQYPETGQAEHAHHPATAVVLIKKVAAAVTLTVKQIVIVELDNVVSQMIQMIQLLNSRRVI